MCKHFEPLEISAAGKPELKPLLADNENEIGNIIDWNFK